MRKLKLHSVTIKNKKGTKGEVSKGANTQILVDGKPLRGVTKVTYTAVARGINKLNIEMLADVEVSGCVLGNYWRVANPRAKKE